MQPWQTLARRRLIDQSPFLVVENHAVALPDGRIIPDWPWIITPDYVNIVAITTENQFLCFRQTKYAISGTSLAPVGGYLDEGEDPLSAAQRELREETGYEAATWISLGHYRVDGNRGAGTAHLFLARDARKVTERSADDLEEQELLLLSYEEVKAALLAGEFKVLGWTTAVALVLITLAEEL
ncbi:MAG: NUDIX hydrolase [Herpetosiphonaceae bacterium]|nr:MAG: NUDIX hydrolase [Herpetosiphonaceae bacterium]